MRPSIFFFLGPDSQEPVTHVVLMMRSWDPPAGPREIKNLRNTDCDESKGSHTQISQSNILIQTPIQGRSSKTGSLESPKPVRGATEPRLRRTDGLHGTRDLVLVAIRWIGWEVRRWVRLAGLCGLNKKKNYKQSKTLRRSTTRHSLRLMCKEGVCCCCCSSENKSLRNSQRQTRLSAWCNVASSICPQFQLFFFPLQTANQSQAWSELHQIGAKTPWCCLMWPGWQCGSVQPLVSGGDGRRCLTAGSELFLALTSAQVNLGGPDKAAEAFTWGTPSIVLRVSPPPPLLKLDRCLNLTNTGLCFALWSPQIFHQQPEPLPSCAAWVWITRSIVVCFDST